MKKPKEIKDCPLCGAVNTVTLVTTNFTPDPVKYGNQKVDWWSYECSSCKEDFTTTESDTISFENLK